MNSIVPSLLLQANGGDVWIDEVRPNGATLDNGVHHTSAHLLIQGTRNGSTWQTLVTHTDSTPSPVSTYALDAAPLRGLRLLQPAGGGAPTRPGILWLGEVEAR